MPSYDYRCGSCGKAFEKNVPVCESGEAQTCECGGAGERAFLYAPAAHGLSDGPGTMARQTHFCKPDPLKETVLSAQRSEHKMDAKTKNLMAAKIANLKAQEPFREKKDYQKDGHPLDGVQT